MKHSSVLPQFLFVIIAALTVSCTNEKLCYKDFIVNHRFISLQDPPIPAPPIVVFGVDEELAIFDYPNTDNEKVDTLWYKLVWESCDRYTMIKKAWSDSLLSTAADTLRVTVLNKDDDTLTIQAKFLTGELTYRMYRQ